MNTTLRTLLFGGIFLISIQLSAQQQRLVGYLPYYQFSRADQIDFSKLTHLCLAFANPDENGEWVMPGSDYAPIVDKAHEDNVDVLLSLAGGAIQSEWWENWKHWTGDQDHISRFCHKTILYLKANNLQGIDMDLEWQYVKDWYSPYVLELADSLKSHDMIFTAALPGTYRYPEISDEALASFDFINMMVYDLTGPWNSDNIGPHSPFSFAENSIKYWRDRQLIPAEDLTLGIPFYGWNFNDPNDIFSFTYRSMVNKAPGNAMIDQVDDAYYNGIPTVREKTRLAMEQVSGVMIWELGQDHFSQYSLLCAIHDEMTKGTSSVESLSDLSEIKVFPNPFNEQFSIENNEESEIQILLTDATGKVLVQKLVAGFSTERIETANFPKGMYFLKMISEQEVSSSKVLVKQN